MARPLPLAPPVTGATSTNFPPYSLTISHFLVALAWLVVGSIGLVWAGPMLARGQWLTPITAAVTHAFTLGWILTSAYGALHQLSPVALGIKVRSWRAGYLTLVLHGAGTAAVVTGLVAWIPMLSSIGWLLVTVGLAIWTWNVGFQLLRAPRANRQARLVALAFAFLWLALLVAGARLGNALGWWIVPREAVVAAHVHLAVAGFASLLVMGVGSHIVPMFLLAHRAPDRPGIVAPPLVATGVLLQAGGWLAGARSFILLGSLVAGTGAIAFLIQAGLWIHHRHRDALDASLRQAVAACSALGVAVLCGLAAMVTDNPRLIAAWGVLMIVGWLGLFVGAVYGRILPFLTWLERYRKRAGQPGVPKIGDMVSPRTLQRIAVLWIGGMAALALAIATGRTLAAGVAALVFTSASVWCALTYARLVFHRTTPRGA